MYVIKVTCIEDTKFSGYLTEYGQDYIGASTDINYYRVKRYKNKSRAIRICNILKLKKYKSEYIFEIKEIDG